MSKLLINESPLMVIPSLAKKIGLNEAIILQQVHYWLNPNYNQNFIEGKYWVHNTYPQWLEQFPFWSIITVKRTIQSLEKSGLLIARQLNQNRFNKAKWYTIDYNKLAKTEKDIEPHGSNKKKRKQIHPYESLENSSDSPEISTVGEGTKTSLRSDQIDTHRRGQIDPFGETEKTHENKGFSNDPIEGINLTPSYIDKITTETTHTEKGACAKNQSENLEQEMLDVWNEIVQVNQPPCRMTSTRKQTLPQFLSQEFSGDVQKWQALCKQIATNDFLMGKGARGWKINLDWILSPDNLTKVLEGTYENPQQQSTTEPATVDQVLAELEQQQDSPVWSRVCKQLVQTLGAPTFKSWISPLKPRESKGHVLELVAPNRFVANWVRQNFRDEILCICRKFKISDVEILHI